MQDQSARDEVMKSVRGGVLQAIEESSFDMMITDFNKTFHVARQDGLAEVNHLPITIEKTN